MERAWRGAAPHGLLSLILGTQDHQLRSAITPCGVDPPPSIIKKEKNAPHACSQANLLRALSLSRFSFPK